jgi:hypothetical protein
MKRCKKCQEFKPPAEFRPNGKSPDGLTKWCKACMDAKRNEGKK